MIGIVIPAHDEAETIDACLRAALRAASHPQLAGEPVEVVLVLDACTDGTAAIAQSHARVHCLDVAFRNVGRARAAGCEWLLERGARWLSFTDADTLVSPRWLVHQLLLDADVVCGSVGVEDWSPHGINGDYLRARFNATYTDADGHPHIHGANLGVSAAAYQSVGGFEALACSEDVALVQACQAAGARIAWSALPRVVTSARHRTRVRGGFGDALMSHLHARNQQLRLPPPQQPVDSWSHDALLQPQSAGTPT